MLKQLSFLIIIGLCCFLVGCSGGSGNQKLAATHPEAIEASFIKGKTTKEDVKKIFGDPNDTDITNDGRLKWVYTHVRSSLMVRSYIPVVNWFSSGTDDTTRKLVVLFKGDILDDYSVSMSKGETKSGCSLFN